MFEERKKFIRPPLIPPRPQEVAEKIVSKLRVPEEAKLRIPLVPPRPQEVAEVVTEPLVRLSAAMNKEIRRIRKQLKEGNPNPITREEAIEIVAGTEWAKHWAEIC